MPPRHHPSPEPLRAIESLPTLVAYLRDELDWPIAEAELEDQTFDYSPADLGLDPSISTRAEKIRQLRPATRNQPWGIFLIEFTDDRVYRTALRELLRGLVSANRRDPNLPAWQHENLLFVCATRDCERICFAHFRGEKAQKARLATFGWQRDSAYVRTLLEFNLPALRWPEDPSDSAAWLKQWASAFDKEPLTKEFFKRFDKVLERIKSDLEEHQKPSLSSAEAYARAQLLLERLLFCYFLQNRGWLNRKRHFLLEGFAPYRERPEGFDYYEKFLEKLFWTLASPATNSPRDPDRCEGVPFLNGGLFDDDEFAPISERRKNNPPLRIRNATFAFVFEHLLEAFNFTVREDTPLNQDVAVDPEMLGKVFESIVLHAESQADYNAPDKRKATGSYYTPRIVVHFICREALRLYLKGKFPGAEWEPKIRAFFDVDATDSLDAEEIARLKAALAPADGRRLLEALQTIKMCDPAVGSGAFPVGLLHELVNLRRVAQTVAGGFVDPLRSEGAKWIHDTKADIVENGLYGVDIQQQAIEICRLRLWLSLIVDYDIGLDPFEADPVQFRQAVAKISQLPNLEMNFRRGDSLLDYVCGVPARVALSDSAWFEKERTAIHKLGRDFHSKAKTGKRKRELRVAILKHRLDLSERLLTEEIGELQNKDADLAADFFGGTVSDAERRRQVAGEIERLEEARKRIAKDRIALEKIVARPLDPRFQADLRKLEGADFDSPFNFSWHIDFADIFSRALGGHDPIRPLGGHDPIRLFESGSCPPRAVEQAFLPVSEKVEQAFLPVSEKVGQTFLSVSEKVEQAFLPVSEKVGQTFLSVSEEKTKTQAGMPVHEKETQAGMPVHEKETQTGMSVLPSEQAETPSPSSRGGFDLILGNPPFVTARNPEKRELYRARWKRVCLGKYLLVCPFFDLSFGLLRPGGQLGFIVSNAFAKREFGKPLIEDFFPTVDLQKIVDCSGLLFPGHGTPTCIVFGQNEKPNENAPIRITATLPGGGDLRTPPEESFLWQAISANHDNPGYADSRISVGDRPRKDIAKWPWNFDAGAGATNTSMGGGGELVLRDFLSEDIGFDVIFGARDLFDNPWTLWRRMGVPFSHLIPFSEGEMLRNYSADETAICLFPYAKTLEPSLPSEILRQLGHWRDILSERPQLGGLSQVEAGFEWFEFYRFTKRGQSPALSFPEIATHAHFVYFPGPRVFTQKAPLVKLQPSAKESDFHMLSGLLNSAAVLLWLKTLCFNKGAGEDEHRDRFEYGGSKVQQLPVPNPISQALRGDGNSLSDRLTALSQACWERGQRMPALAMKKAFEKPGEAYHGWNSSLPGYVAPGSEWGTPFDSPASLRANLQRVVARREELRAEMIALQEEMDWIVYEAYGLIELGVTSYELRVEEIDPLAREERPFVLWGKVGQASRLSSLTQDKPGATGETPVLLSEIFDRAAALIPAEWPEGRRALWRARLGAIRDNEHIRRIEQPVYKRRWDEQWKVGNSWQCGEAAYRKEFEDAFDWWLSEKAEWWLEKEWHGRMKRAGGVDLESWTTALWNDARVRAAWECRLRIADCGLRIVEGAKNCVMRSKDSDVESQDLLGRVSPGDFARHFRNLVKEQSVPENIPWAVPWEKIKVKVPVAVKRIRGKLNVPRERFRTNANGEYVWAGKKP